MNVFAWWPQVSEKPWEWQEKEIKSEALETPEAKQTTEDIFWWGNPVENQANAEKARELEQADNQKEQTEKQAEQEQYKDNPNYPILERLEQYVPREQFEEAMKKFQETKDKEEAKQVVLELANNIPDPKAKEKYVALLEWKKEIIDENNFENTEFSKDAKTVDIELDKWIWGLEIMLAENYVSVPVENWEQNVEQSKEADMKSTMELVTNNVMEGQSSDFRKRNWELIQNIREADTLQKKYDLLKDLYKDSLKEDAKKWWKKTEKEIFSKKESLKQKAERLKAEYEKVRQMWDWVQNQVKLAEIEDEYRKIIAEWNETNNFEAEVSSLSWWKEDQSPESTPTLEDMSKIV